MIIVHDIFICKPGNASKLAKLFKEVMVDNKELVNIMSDLTGQYNRVVMVTKYDSLSAFEESWKKYEQNTDEMKKMKDYPGILGVINFDEKGDAIGKSVGVFKIQKGKYVFIKEIKP